MWYYKYDGLGRRIAKECPQCDLKIEFVWDGDQLAYTQTFKNDELQSRRHCIFNGWQLLAQQDWYSELEQNHNGNVIHHRAETSYAITQPNGKVLALFNLQGRKVWSEEPKSIWGLRLNSLFRYSKLSPFDPQMLYAGQWLDEESRLAYNRFRYYDPESGCYISSDPIGLAECPLNKPSKKSSYFATSRKDAFNKAKRDAGIPKTQQLYKVEKVSLKDGYGDFVRKSNGEPVKAREYYYKNSKPKGKDIVIQEHSLGHSKATTGSGKEPHFNVRPIDNINTGYVPGTYGIIIFNHSKVKYETSRYYRK